MDQLIKELANFMGVHKNYSAKGVAIFRGVSRRDQEKGPLRPLIHNPIRRDVIFEWPLRNPHVSENAL